MPKPHLLVVGGPTASGKSAVAVESGPENRRRGHFGRLDAGLSRDAHRHCPACARGNAGDRPSPDRLSAARAVLHRQRLPRGGAAPCALVAAQGNHPRRVRRHRPVHRRADPAHVAWLSPGDEASARRKLHAVGGRIPGAGSALHERLLRRMRPGQSAERGCTKTTCAG